jgi:hypothetical protein
MIPRRTEPGKWGRAIRELNAKRMAQPQGESEGVDVLVRERVEHEDSSPAPVDLSDQLTVSNVHHEDIELEVVDLYTVHTKSQYLSVPHRVLQDSQESPGILRTPAGLHYDFADFKF